ncbi:hypothetical protein ASPSYDRAFT_45828 [Aspergillus sydowii CBS 593.65]|uniref:Uncharacterized protein n=1 Tax=Aspergillus sydowii CBS 593.65 TaxID=1036612 RepID=A0A1L9TEL6_9EURO|nr:uncharacterized protein ASPSYDRAFT_45828 [Aspergillus sydowii CBS 593.65]OJJ57866.1 hypothetical protein ASPSYDRAFT_45828 [Aspergillus sydowii CBS 593.65]
MRLSRVRLGRRLAALGLPVSRFPTVMGCAFCFATHSPPHHHDPQSHSRLLRPAQRTLHPAFPLTLKTTIRQGRQPAPRPTCFMR